MSKLSAEKFDSRLLQEAKEQFNKMAAEIMSKEKLEMELGDLEAWALTEGQELCRRLIEAHDNLRYRSIDNKNVETLQD